MPREVHIPLFLWICAAICAHFLMGGGGLVVGKIHDDHAAFLDLVANARDRVRQEEQTFEVALSDDPNAKPADPPPDEPKPDDAKPDDTKDDKKDPAKPDPKVDPPKPEPPKVDPKKPDPKVEAKKPETKKPEPKKDEPKIVVVPKKKDEPPPPPKQDPLVDKRIAVRQQVKPDQKDNPDAKFIADQANKVDQETRATQTNHEQDDKLPTPGGNHAGPDKQPGDSDRTKIAGMDEHQGDPRKAPGEKGTEFDVQRIPAPLPAPVAKQGPASNQQAPGQNAPQAAPTPPAAAPPTPANTAPAVPKAAPPNAAPGTPSPPQGGTQSPNVQNSPEGGWTWKPTNPNAGAGPATSGTSASSASPKQAAAPIFGRGVKPSPGAVSPNLSQGDVTAIVGQGEIRRMREADGERRKSEHKGSWAASSFERWRASIENYVSTVKPGNQTSLNAAQSPFATYLNGMHNRIHPFFADAFLGSLDGLPKEHPLNNPKMITRLEIVLTKDGHLQKMGIVKTSGVTAFDIAALDSVNRAQPFGPAPAAIISKDGNVYLHWEFHRDEVYACSTMNARPYLLNIEPVKPVEPPPPGPAPTGPQEKGPPPANTQDTRSGSLVAPEPSRATWWMRPREASAQKRG